MKKNKVELKDIKCFIFDMDGTLYSGNILFKGVLELFTYFKKNSIKFFFLTNNSSNTKRAYFEKLNSLGINMIEESQIITSGDIIIQYLSSFNFKNIYIVGTPALENQFTENGFNLVTKKNSNVDCVVVGFDKTFTYNKAEIAVHYLRKGIPFISTNEDLVCPVENNEFIPDCGAITSLLELASGRTTTYIGKPRKETYNYLIKYIGFDKDKLAIVGDRLYTDIATGFNNNFTSIAVLTGEMEIKDLKKSKIKPTYIFKSVNEIYLALNGSLE
jgi:NagD protein